MIRSCSELNAQLQPSIIPTPPSKRSTASTLNNRNSTATDEYDFEMELDEHLGVHNGAPWENDEEDDDLEAKQKKLQELTQSMLEYGMELKQEFANDPRREVKRALEDTFALIAYENVRESSLAPLLETKGRVPVAEELNSAILGMHPLIVTRKWQTLTLISEPGQVELCGSGTISPADRGTGQRAGRRRWAWCVHQRPERLLAISLPIIPTSHEDLCWRRRHDDMIFLGFKAFACTLYACIYIGSPLSRYEPGRRYWYCLWDVGVPLIHHAVSAHAGLGAREWM